MIRWADYALLKFFVEPCIHNFIYNDDPGQLLAGNLYKEPASLPSKSAFFLNKLAT